MALLLIFLLDLSVLTPDRQFNCNFYSNNSGSAFLLHSYALLTFLLRFVLTPIHLSNEVQQGKNPNSQFPLNMQNCFRQKANISYLKILLKKYGYLKIFFPHKKRHQEIQRVSYAPFPPKSNPSIMPIF